MLVFATKGAVLSSVAYWVKESGIFSIEALLKVVENHKYATTLEDAIRSSEKLKDKNLNEVIITLVCF